MSSGTDTIVRIRLTPHQVRESLDLVDQTNEVAAGAEKRKHTRWRFRLPDPVRMACVREGGQVVYELAPRDLSAKGLAGLVGGYIHTGTACVVCVPMVDGEQVRLGGTIRTCTHVAGSIHEVGIELDEAVEIGCFVTCAEEETAPTQALLAALERAAGNLAMLARQGAPWVDLRKAARDIQQLTGARG